MDIERIGTYEGMGLLGQGGMGAVYRGRDPRFDREVAIKVLHEQFQRDPEVVERFKSEAVIQAKLSHPHIVSVLDFVTEAGSLAMVMEYVDGRSLERVIADCRGPMDPGRALHLMSQILGAMGYAHSMGLVHRDIKPSNIMVQEIGGQEFVKVMDFGIAKILGSEKFKTATGAKMGTLAYMSPEHVKSPKNVDSQSDIYSLGVVFYEMLSGRVPFDAESEYELMRQIIDQPHASLSTRGLKIEPSLARVLDRALAKSAQQRFRSCEEMRDALADVGRPESASGAGRGDPYAERETSQGGRVRAASATGGVASSAAQAANPGLWVAAVLLLIGGIAWGVFANRQQQAARALEEASAVANAREARQQEELTRLRQEAAAAQERAADAERRRMELAAQAVDSSSTRPPGRWPETSERELRDVDLEGIDLTDLVLMRNEIYARRGRRFKTPAIRRYFESQPWYSGVAYEVSGLTATELRNVDRIRRVEKRKGGA